MKLPKFYSEQKLLLAFEYGLVISEVARQQNIEVTKELSERSEKMLLNEFSKKKGQILSLEMLPNILSIFETDMDKTTSGESVSTVDIDK